MVIRPVRGKLGWFQLDNETGRPLVGLPGVKVEGLRFEDGEIVLDRSTKILVHESHLPLVGIEPPRRFIHEEYGHHSLSELWTARDRWSEPLGFKLRVTQQQAIDFISVRRGTLLGDDLRLGKTLSAICSHDPKQGQFVVVAPLSTRAVWLGWMRRVFPGLPIGIAVGRNFDANVFQQPLIFMHYDILPRWRIVRELGMVVFDEAHMLTNPDAQRSISAVALASQARCVVAMTGTPIWNMPPDLWSVLGLITPGAWGDFWSFAKRYGAPVSRAHGIDFTGASNVEELHARLSSVMLRRRWIDVADDLPPITRQIIVAEVSQAERNKLDILAGKLQSERNSTVGNLAAYRRQVTGLKQAVVVAEAEKIISRGEPVVIWTWHKDYADRLARRLDGLEGRALAYVIHGDIDPAKRDGIMDQWRESATPAVLIATMSVAQVGIDLSHARHAIFAEIDYTPAILGQAEMRTYSPTRPMDITFVVANHLIDQRIVRALVQKLGAANPFGVGAAVDAIDALRDAVMGPTEAGDLDRLLEDLLASAA